MTAEKPAKPSLRFAEPYEVLRPCRSRIVAGAAMIAVLAAVTFLLSG